MRWFAAQMLAATLLGAGVAAAQTPGEGLVLRWRAPQGCPSGGAVAAAVTQLLGRPLESVTPRRHASARVRPARGRWSLQLTVTAGQARRRRALVGDTCAEVAEAAALVLALSIDPALTLPADGADGPAPPEEAAPPVAEAPPAAQPAPPAAQPAPPPEVLPSQTTSPRAARLRGFARLAALGDLGAQPSLTWGVTAALGLAVGAFRVEVSGSYFGPQRALTPAGDPSQGGDFSLFAGALRGCVGASSGRLALGGCAGAELGVQAGEAFGVTRPSRGEALWLALPIVATFRGALSRRLGAYVEAGAAVPLLRRQFSVEGLGGVFRPAAVTVRAAAGVEVVF